MNLDRRQFFTLPAAAVPLLAQKQEGAGKAPVTLEIFSDFECPGCKQLHESTIRQLRASDLVTTGKLRIIHREFPLPMHRYARQAACYACAAERLGLYTPVADALFRDQEVWSKTGRLEEALARAVPAAKLAQLKTLAKDPAVLAEVEADLARGQKMNTRQTPTMLFLKGNGLPQPVTGVVSYNIVRQYVDMLLKMK
jgi:protein-disulfide isomerase